MKQNEAKSYLIDRKYMFCNIDVFSFSIPFILEYDHMNNILMLNKGLAQ